MGGMSQNQNLLNMFKCRLKLKAHCTLVGMVYFPSGSVTLCVSPQLLQANASLLQSGLMLLTLTTVPLIATNFPYKFALRLFKGVSGS